MTDTEGDQIRAQLAALRAGSKNRLRRFRLLEYVCRSCGQTILSVMATSPYRVIAGRGVSPQQRPLIPPGAREAFLQSKGEAPSVLDWRGFYREHLRDADIGAPDRVDKDGGSFVRIRHDFEDTAEDNTQVTFLCRCASWSIPETAIAADLRGRVKRRTWPPHADSC